MINYKAIGRRIACYRKKLSMTQATLSEELNVSESYISQVERGSAKVSLSRLDEISEILEVDLAFLLSDEVAVSDVPINIEIHEIIKEWPADKVDFLAELVVCADERIKQSKK